MDSALGKSPRIFVSHSSKDKLIATTIKYYLETFFGLEVFVAHEDIIPTSNWPDKIQEELGSCDIFLALITPSFKTSDFADQESGYVLSLGKFIIPVAIGETPYGFLDKIQALKFTVKNPKEEWEWITFSKSIIKAIQFKNFYKELTVGAKIKALRSSYSFSNTRIILGLLREEDSFNKAQVNAIIRAFLANNQVSEESYSTPGFYKWIIRENSKKIQKELLKEFKNSFTPKQ